MRSCGKVAAAALAVVMAAVSCRSGEVGEPVSEPPRNWSVYFVDGNELVEHSLPGGDMQVRDRFPARGVLAPDASRVVFVRAKKKTPELVTRELGSDGSTTLGPGRAPVFSPGGDLIAAIERDRDYSICPQPTTRKLDKSSRGCRPAERVLVYGFDGSDAGRVAVGAGLWEKVSWTRGDRVLALGPDSASVGFVGATADDILQVHHSPKLIWGISPAEEILLVTVDNRALFVTFTGELVLELDVSGRRLRRGTWSPDGRTIAAVLEGENRTVATIDVATGEVTDIPDTAATSGVPVWDITGERFSFLAADGGLWRLWLCSSEGSCETSEPLEATDPQVAAVV